MSIDAILTTIEDGWIWEATGPAIVGAIGRLGNRSGVPWKPWLKRLLPRRAWGVLKSGRDIARGTLGWISGKVLEYALARLETRQLLRILHAHDLNVSRISDFYSPLPVAATLERNLSRWFRPSELVGVQYDLDQMKTVLRRMVVEYWDEYQALPSYDETYKKAYGRGYTRLDAMLLYLMIRDVKPRRYIEIGSGLSTYYSWLATVRNESEGSPSRITCIDPYPYQMMYAIPGVEIIKAEVQDTGPSLFDELSAGDVLFIDSTHVVKIDGDVPHLYLEVIPRLKRGVLIHVHDVHFPYNVPYPAEFYISRIWPLFRTEAMIVQAFLSYNEAYRVRMSMPMLRFFGEDFLRAIIPNYESVRREDANTHFGALWLERVK